MGRRQFWLRVVANAYAWVKSVTDSIERILFWAALFSLPWIGVIWAALRHVIPSWLIAVWPLVFIFVAIGEGAYLTFNEAEATPRAGGAASQAKRLGVRYGDEAPYVAAEYSDYQPYQHSVGILNPVGNPKASRVRVEIVSMDPPPQNPNGRPGEFRSVVPMKRGGDPRSGADIGPGTEELWTIATVFGPGSDGKIWVQGIAVANWPLGSKHLWEIQRGERWRLHYAAFAENVPGAEFDLVMFVVDGKVRCKLEGSE